MKIIVFLIILVLSSCGSHIKDEPKTLAQSNVIKMPSFTTNFMEFEPKRIGDFILEGFQVDFAFKIDSLIILAAYAAGDLETAENPKNWGDRLVLYKNEQIKFQSQPVGDVYLYEPHFYKNQANNKIVIICQLAYEYYFGGEAFLLDNGKITWMGGIEIEAAKEEIRMTDIVQIAEQDETISFNFNADSLIFKPGDNPTLIKNNNFHYVYKNLSWLVIGI